MKLSIKIINFTKYSRRDFCINNRLIVQSYYKRKWATTWQNQQSDCAPSEDSDQPGHPPSLIRVFAVRMKKAGVLSYPLSAQRRLWSDCADAQADLSLRWAHCQFVGLSCRGSNDMIKRAHLPRWFWWAPNYGWESIFGKLNNPEKALWAL